MSGARTICFFGTYDERAHPRVQVLREGLAAHGHEIVVCNVPLGLDTRARLRILQRPWTTPALVVRIAVSWIRLLWRSRRIPTPDVVVVGYLGHFDVHLARVRFRGVPVVLDHMVGLADTASDRGIHTGSLVARALAAVDAGALAAADLVLCDTDDQAAELDVTPDTELLVARVGAPTSWFAVASDGQPEPRSESPLRVVFYGLFTPLQGAPTIGEAAALLHRDGVACRLTMIGTGQDRIETIRASSGSPDVTWVDWVDADDLPGLVAAHDVCLGIFGTTPKARRVVPNKVYQGAAAGTVVVTSDTPCQRAALGAVGVHVPGGDARSLADALSQLASDPAGVAERRVITARWAADHFSPAAVAESLDRWVGS